MKSSAHPFQAVGFFVLLPLVGAMLPAPFAFPAYVAVGFGVWAAVFCDWFATRMAALQEEARHRLALGKWWPTGGVFVPVIFLLFTWGVGARVTPSGWSHFFEVAVRGSDRVPDTPEEFLARFFFGGIFIIPLGVALAWVIACVYWAWVGLTSGFVDRQIGSNVLDQFATARRSDTWRLQMRCILDTYLLLFGGMMLYGGVALTDFYISIPDNSSWFSRVKQALTSGNIDQVGATAGGIYLMVLGILRFAGWRKPNKTAPDAPHAPAG